MSDDIETIRKAIKCGKTVRDTFGGNVGGGKDVFIEAIEALDRVEMAASAPSVPDGWKLVPKEPTDEMKERAAFNLCCDYDPEFVENNEQFAMDVWAELLAAAPLPPAPKKED